MQNLLRQSTRCVVVILFAAVPVREAAAEDSFASVQCSAYVYPNNRTCVATLDPNTPNTLTFVVESTGGEGTDAASAGVSGFVRADYGDLGIDITATATGSRTLDASTSAYALAQFSDTFEVISSTTALGTATQLSGIHYVTAGLDATPDSFTPLRNLSTLTFESLVTVRWGRLDGSIGQWADYLRVDDVLDEYSWNRSSVIDTYVGARVSVSYMMTGSVVLSAGAGTGTSPVVALIDAGNSGHIYFDALDSAVTLVSGSGHDYSSPTAIPEPSTYALLAAGLGIIAFVTRTRRRRTRVAPLSLH